jgi:hypothetical protein
MRAKRKIRFMNLKYCGFLLILLISSNSYGQKSLSKSEISISWKENFPEQENEMKSINDLEFSDSLFQKKIQSLIRRVQALSDTFAFSLIADYGLTTVDSCRSGITPSEFFIYWRRSGRTFIQKATNNCLWPEKEVFNISIFSFFAAHRSEISQERIMPPIFGARIENGKVVYTRETSTHDISYTIFGKIGSFHKIALFSKNDITNQQGLFYADNLTSSLYKWFLLIKKDTSYP